MPGVVFSYLAGSKSACWGLLLKMSIFRVTSIVSIFLRYSGFHSPPSLGKGPIRRQMLSTSSSLEISALRRNQHSSGFIIHEQKYNFNCERYEKRPMSCLHREATPGFIAFSDVNIFHDTKQNCVRMHMSRNSLNYFFLIKSGQLFWSYHAKGT